MRESADEIAMRWRESESKAKQKRQLQTQETKPRQNGPKTTNNVLTAYQLGTVEWIRSRAMLSGLITVQAEAIISMAQEIAALEEQLEKMGVVT